VSERAVVTGITGFVGGNVARALVASGVQVHAFVREGARVDRVPDLAESVVFHRVGADAPAIDAAVSQVQPHVVFHLATHFVAEHVPADVDPMLDANVALPARLADALSRVALSRVEGAPRFVNAGTAWQHVEGAAYRPKNLYASMKQAAEDILGHYAERGLLRVVTVNLYDTFGPGDSRGKLLNALVGAVRSGEPLAMSSGDQIVDLVHGRDVASAFLRAAALVAEAPPGAPAAYAVSSGEPLRIREVVERLGRVAGRPVPVRWGERPDRPGDMVTHWDAGPALPGWEPAVSLDDGLAELLAEAGGSDPGSPTT
jgi:nucleoside-diphosphate-sugar epimerase